MSQNGEAIQGLTDVHAPDMSRPGPLLAWWQRRLRIPARPEATELSSALYGSLLVTALVVIEMQSDTSAEAVGMSTAAAVTVFWLAHVWAALVDLRARTRVARRDVLTSALAELPMLLAAAPPLLALAAARVAGTTVGEAEAVALAVAVAQLFLLGLAAGRPSERGWRGAVGVAAVDVGLGLAIVGLKAAVAH